MEGGQREAQQQQKISVLTKVINIYDIISGLGKKNFVENSVFIWYLC